MIFPATPPSPLYIFKAEKRQISLFQKKLSDFNCFYTKMTVVSRAIGPWGAQPRPRPLSAAAAEKRRQFERFSKCFDLHNSNAKITLEIRGTNVGCLRPQNWPLMTSNGLWRPLMTSKLPYFNLCLNAYQIKARNPYNTKMARKSSIWPHNDL